MCEERLWYNSPQLPTVNFSRVYSFEDCLKNLRSTTALWDLRKSHWATCRSKQIWDFDSERWCSWKLVSSGKAFDNHLVSSFISHIPSISKSWWIHHLQQTRATNFSPPLAPLTQGTNNHVSYWGHQLLLPAFSLPCLLTLFTYTATRLILWKYKWECYFSGTIC